VTGENKLPSPRAARAGGVLTGLGSAGGGLAIGPDTVIGKVLILVSPIASVVVDYAVIQIRASLERWEALRPVRQARRTLKAGIKDSDIPEDRKVVYRERLADLKEAQVDWQLDQLAAAGITVVPIRTAGVD
jgi:hypothetical protein